MKLTFTTLWANLADDTLLIFSYFVQKAGFDISCKLSQVVTICMKCHILFSEKNLSKWYLMKNLTRVLSINVSSIYVYVNKGCIQKRKLLVIVLLWTPAPVGTHHKVKGSGTKCSLSLCTSEYSPGICCLTLKSLRKPVSENVVHLCYLLIILANFLEELSDLGPHCLQK